MLRTKYVASRLFVILALSLTAIAFPHSAAAQSDSVARAALKAKELAKFDSAETYKARTGPGGSDWDAQYRTFIQTDSAATSKGLPAHAAAAAQIRADAALSNEKLQMHKGWILFIKHFSQAYRPESATADFKKLYVELVNMEFAARKE